MFGEITTMALERSMVSAKHGPEEPIRIRLVSKWENDMGETPLGKKEPVQHTGSRGVMSMNYD